MSEWKSYEKFGCVEVRPYESNDKADPCIYFSLADLNRTSLDGGMIARNPLNSDHQWYISPEYFAKHYRATNTE